MRYKRALLKLSGQAVSGPHDMGFHPESLEHIADEILSLCPQDGVRVESRVVSVWESSKREPEGYQGNGFPW